MGWMSELKNVYDLEKDIVGQKIDDVVLLPMFHTEQNAHIEVIYYIKQIYSSIIYGKSIPQNILTALFNRASNPLAYDKEYN